MLSTWNVQAIVNVDLEVNATAKTITRSTGSFSGLVVVGDFLTLSGFTNVENNTQVQVLEVVSATVIKYVAAHALVNESGVGTSYKRADKLTIEIGRASCRERV